MNSAEKREALQGEEIFSSLTAKELDAFLGQCDDAAGEPGSLLVSEGSRAEEFYILLQGKLAVYKAKRLICELHPIDYVGMMSAIDGEPRSASVKVVEKSLLLRVPFPLFWKYLGNRPDSLLALMKIFSRRIRLDNIVLAREFEQTNIVVHDMKNLLSVFQLLENLPGSDPSTMERYLHFMKMARNNIASLVEQALTSMKHFIVSESTPVHSLQDMIDEMVESDFITHPDLRDKRIVVDLARGMPDFQFSKLQIRRVLLNLLVNAAQASEAGGEIKLQVEEDDDQAVIKIKDQGSGIPESIAGRIFESHFTTKEKGSGLGLVSCRQIIEKDYGGTISFVSDPLQGTVFTISLPFRKNRVSPACSSAA